MTPDLWSTKVDIHMRHTIARVAATVVVTISALVGSQAGAMATATTGQSAGEPRHSTTTAVVIAADACVANENLGEIATNFISRCRMGSIRQEFPGQHYGDTLEYIKGCGERSCKTAWKLLNDNRFKK